MNQKVLLFIVMLSMFACNTPESLEFSDIGGLWKLELDAENDEKKIPFFLEFIQTEGEIKAAVWNGEENIQHEDVIIRNDSVFIESPYFNSGLSLHFERNIISGTWVDRSRENYSMTVIGKYNLTQRFKFEGPLEESIDGTWQVKFSPGTQDAYDAIGLFSTDENSMKGTFITETGDYRFLEGGFASNKLKLSTFDGAHAFLFEADKRNDTLFGTFYSGKHYNEPFIAWRSDSAAIKSPYEMTELINPDEPVSFEFENLSGEVVTLNDSVFKGKPVLVQLIGTWCPNCMDESTFLVEQTENLRNAGVEVVALAFERSPREQATKPMMKFKTTLGIEYPLLYAGEASKKEATKSIPWLKEVKSYPTLLFVLPNHKVFKIHTGFYGPGTGYYYEKQSKELLDDIKQLVQLSKTTL